MHPSYEIATDLHDPSRASGLKSPLQLRTVGVGKRGHLGGGLIPKCHFVM